MPLLLLFANPNRHAEPDSFEAPSAGLGPMPQCTMLNAQCPMPNAECPLSFLNHRVLNLGNPRKTPTIAPDMTRNPHEQGSRLATLVE
jgi:hypothetical protein